jgi:ABC-type amino acid transport substrate-binding protein
MRRSLIAIVVSGGAALALAVGAAPAVAALPSTIQVATFVPDAPFEFRRGGKLTGLDIQLTERIARTIGITAVQWRVLPQFPDVLSAVAADRYPMAAASITVTAARAQRVNFGNPYYVNTIAVVARKGSPINGWGDLSGETVGAVAGTTGQTAANTLPNSKVRIFRTFPVLYRALLDAKVAAAINDYPQSQWYVRANAKKFKMAGTLPGTEASIAFAFAPDQDELRQAFNRGLATLRSNGTLGTLVNRWIPAG